MNRQNEETQPMPMIVNTAQTDVIRTHPDGSPALWTVTVDTVPPRIWMHDDRLSFETKAEDLPDDIAAWDKAFGDA